MIDKELIRLIMQEVGPRDERILEVVQTSDESWTVRFDDVDVEIELERETRRVVFSTEIGVVPEDRREEIYELLLTYSLLWRETGGLRMALESEGRAIQLLDLHCSMMTTDLLAVVLHNIEERTLLWREFFAKAEFEPSPATPPEYPMIQV